MANQFHKNLNGQELHIPGYFSPSDPGSVGAGLYWYDSSKGVLKIRNLSNGGWEVMSGAYFGNSIGGGETFPGPVGAGRLWVDTTLGVYNYILKVRNSTNTGWVVVNGGVQPIGCLGMWHKALCAGTSVATLAWGWVECNGQVLSDSESPLNGKTIPNINGGGYFIRGSATSGTVQSSQNLTHTHGAGTLYAASHLHGLTAGGAASAGDHTHTITLGGGWGDQYADTCKWSSDDGNHNTYAPGTSTNGAHTHSLSGTTDYSGNLGVGGATAADGGSEARPVNISMVIIMRVK